jgi:hypothetical protein
MIENLAQIGKRKKRAAIASWDSSSPSRAETYFTVLESPR